jgi:hypothetical protein
MPLLARLGQLTLAPLRAHHLLEVGHEEVWERLPPRRDVKVRPYRDEPMPVELGADGRFSKSELFLDLLLASFVAHLQDGGIACDGIAG